MKRLRKVVFGEARYPGALLREDDEATLIDGLCRRCHGVLNKEKDENDSVFDRLKVPTESCDPVKARDYVEARGYVEGCELCEFDRLFREADEQLEKVGV
ncbi:MAG: hypothetical protein OXU27_03205 [Candidatus Poribacteria bacterium]|nr:hypothetical protein [Candidatus Poribacteria bacterium]